MSTEGTRDFKRINVNPCSLAADTSSSGIRTTPSTSSTTRAATPACARLATYCPSVPCQSAASRALPSIISISPPERKLETSSRSVGEHPSHWRIEVFAFDLHHRIGSFELRVMKHTANRYSHTICPFPRGTPVVPVDLTAKRAVDNNLSWLRGQSVHVTVRQHTS